jgi:hypothetical protein
MYDYDQPPPRRDAPPSRLRLDGTDRALLAGLGVALLGYLALHFLVPAEPRQNIYGGVQPYDAFDLRQGDGNIEGRLRVPPSVGNGMAPDRSRDRYERYYQEGPRQFSRCPAEGCPPARGMRPW